MILKKEDRLKVIKACKITADILQKLVLELKKGSFKTEFDIYRWLRKETYKRKCKFAFRPVVSIGKNAYEIHHIPNKTKLKHGFLVVDFGVKYKGLCSDCTRTFFIGKPLEYEVDMYDLVLIAQKTGLNEVKKGVYCADIDAIVRACLWDYYGNFFHSTGHGVGKKVHKAPRVSPRSKSKLQENDIITVEPGLYFKDWFGIRIEDTLLVKNKAIVLTKMTKKMIRIKSFLN